MIKEKAQITSISEVNSREGKNGNVYSNLTLVVKVFGFQNNYRELALNVGGDRINDVLEFQVGQMVEIGYSVSSRYWAKGDRWFTTADLITINDSGAVKAQKFSPNTQNAPVVPKSQPMDVNTPGANVDDKEDDLPF